MPITSLSGANPCLPGANSSFPEHKIGIFVLGQTGKLLRSTAQWRCCGALLALLDEGTVA